MSLQVARPLVGLILKTYWRVQVHGSHHVPQQGPVILAANHIGFLDGPLLVAFTRRLSFVLAKQELFNGAMGTFLGHVGQIPIDRSRVDKKAISRSIQVLRSERILGLFPEGRRGDGTVSRAKGGAAYFAMVTGAPIVPVALLGTREPGHSTGQTPRRGARMHVVYGTPLQLPRAGWPRRKGVVAELTETVRIHLANHVEAAQELTGLALPGPPGVRTPGPERVQGEI
jgi:1-acyl-sn-glycerol-3-phosphate acyltransferase